MRLDPDTSSRKKQLELPSISPIYSETMLTRLAIILALLWQPFAATAPVVRSGERPESCAAMACCEVVTCTTCCGETVVERTCSMESPGVCPCGVRGSDEPAPSREAPKTSVERDRVQLVRPSPSRPVIVFRAVAPRGPANAIFSALYANRTHNTVRALLSNWRT